MQQIDNILTEEPDTGIPYVRICGGVGGVIRYPIPITANGEKRMTVCIIN